MKIMKEGKIPNAPTYKGTCSHCGCVFEADAYEVLYIETTEPLYTHRSGMTTKTTLRIVCFCPTCNTQTIVIESK